MFIVTGELIHQKQPDFLYLISSPRDNHTTNQHVNQKDLPFRSSPSMPFIYGDQRKAVLAVRRRHETQWREKKNALQYATTRDPVQDARQ
jgi:hypothetical protein